MRKLLLSIPAVFAISLAAVAQAQERIEMEGTTITGNRELPRVLYIVPWKTAERFELDSPPIDSIMERRLEPLDRAAFRRTIRYHEAIFSRATPE